MQLIQLLVVDKLEGRSRAMGIYLGRFMLGMGIDQLLLLHHHLKGIMGLHLYLTLMLGILQWVLQLALLLLIHVVLNQFIFI